MTHRPFVSAALAAAASLVLAVSASAQDAPLAHGDTSVFRRLDLPTPNQYRSASGQPGPAYWQQRADYAITTSLDTASKKVSGSETITYTNNSPDTLRFVWLQVDQNIYASGSLGSYMNPDEDTRWAARGFEGGYHIRSAKVGGATVQPLIRDTDMRLDLPRPLAPGSAVKIDLDFDFAVPEHGSDRMGREGSLYEIAQWFPRMVVYDDVNGWNADPYLGQGEFYRDFGDYDVRITVPAGYVVGASGMLQNPDEVLTAAERERLARAKSSSRQVQVIGPNEVGRPTARPTTRGTLTWHYLAENVHDFAWAASPNFRWDAMTGQRGVLCNALYQPQDTAWVTAADMTCFSVDEFSNRWFPYPWPQATSIAGPVAGMEYPMIVFVGGSWDSQEVFETIAHEHGHEWFPMIVSSNERRYTWMDEGFNTFIDTWANDRRYPGTDTRADYLNDYYRGTGRGDDEPLMTPPDRVVPQALGLVGYYKPALVLHLLRDQVLGPQLFDQAFRTYVQRWAFRHPTPADFFRTMEDVSGMDLDWFFREWFYTSDRLDQAIAGVDQERTDDGEWRATIHLVNNTPLVMPAKLTLTTTRGETRTLDLPVQIWYRGQTYDYTTTLPAPLASATLDAAGMLPDARRDNDAWSAGAASSHAK